MTSRRADKPRQESSKYVFGYLAAKVIATQSTWMKAAPAETIAAAARALGADVETVNSVPAAVERALEIAGPDDLVLVTGSFYTIGEVPSF